MQNGYNQYFQTLKNVQEMMDKVNTIPKNISIAYDNKVIQNYYETVNSPAVKSFLNQLEVVRQYYDGSSNAHSLFISPAVRLVSESAVKAVVENQKHFIEQINAGSGQRFDSILKWHSSIRSIVNSQNINLDQVIPDSFNEPLNQITTALDDVPTQTSNEDIKAEITVDDSEIPYKKPVTWGDLITIIFTIWSFFYTQYASNLDSIEREKQLLETKKQTELLEIQIEIERETLRLEQMKYEQQEQLEVKFDNLTETIENFINNETINEND